MASLVVEEVTPAQLLLYYFANSSTTYNHYIYYFHWQIGEGGPGMRQAPLSASFTPPTSVSTSHIGKVQHVGGKNKIIWAYRFAGLKSCLNPLKKTNATFFQKSLLSPNCSPGHHQPASPSLPIFQMCNLLQTTLSILRPFLSLRALLSDCSTFTDTTTARTYATHSHPIFFNLSSSSPRTWQKFLHTLGELQIRFLCNGTTPANFSTIANS